MFPVSLLLMLLIQAPSPAPDAAGPAAPAGTPDDRPWPCRLGVPRPLRAGVEELWQSSPTFRRQCVRIAEADVTIALAVAPARTRNARALSSIYRRDGRVFYVSVMLKHEMFVPEDVPHELEHVLEQIEGQNLDAEVRAGRAIWLSSIRAYETDRARNAGTQARREILVSRDPSAPRAVVAKGRSVD